jgi:serine protease Do
MKRTRSVTPVVSLAAAALVGAWFLSPSLKGQPVTPPPVVQELTSYRDVVKRVLPAVVAIETKSKQLVSGKGQRFKSFDDSMIPKEFRKFFDNKEFMFPEIPDAPFARGSGSGFLVSADGLIVTNNHVVKDAEQVTVYLHDGRKFTTTDIKQDPQTDLALVRIDAKGALPFLEWGNSDAAEIGDRVLAVGAPFGLRGTVTHGIVSAKGRSLSMSMYEDYIQTDAAINPGNSGGPLVNLEGKVIGINTAIKSHSGGFQGVGLAIPSNMARSIMTQLARTGTVQRGYLGVQVRELAADVAGRLGIEKGVLVAKTLDDGPAARAGIQEGDIITAVGNQTVGSARQLQSIVAELPRDQAVDVHVLRDGKKETVKVTIASQPRDFGASLRSTPTPRGQTPRTSVDKIGADLADLTPELAEDYGYPRDTKGVVVTRVEPESLAAAAGIVKGALIVKVDNQPVHNAADAKAALEKASLKKGVLLQTRTPEHGVSYVVIESATQDVR